MIDDLSSERTYDCNDCLLRMLYRTSCRRRRKWLVGNSIVNSFPIRIIKSHPSRGREWNHDLISRKTWPLIPRPSLSPSSFTATLSSVLSTKTWLSHIPPVLSHIQCHCVMVLEPTSTSSWSTVSHALPPNGMNPHTIPKIWVFRMFFHFFLCYKSSAITGDIAVDHVFFAVWF